MAPSRPDRELAPVDVLLDQGRLAVAVDDGGDLDPQLFLVVDHAGGADPLGRALGVGLDDEREGQVGVEPLAPGLHDLELGRQDAVLAQHLLAQRLVEGDGQGGRVRAGVGDAEELAQSRHLSLAVPSLDPLRDVEDEIDVRLGQDPGQVGGGLEVDHDEPLPGQRVGDGDDGLGRVELGLLVAVVGALDVVGEADPDGAVAAAAAVPEAQLVGGGHVAAQGRGVEDGRDGVVVGQAQLGRGDEDRRDPAQGGKRVGLEQVDAAVVGDAEVEPGDVLEPQAPDRIVGDGAEAGGHVARH